MTTTPSSREQYLDWARRTVSQDAPGQFRTRREKRVNQLTALLLDANHKQSLEADLEAALDQVATLEMDAEEP